MNYYYAGLKYDPNDLSHHGIKGQRWGIRRFQNPDGSLTPEGRKRYGSEKEQRALADRASSGERYLGERKSDLAKTNQVKAAVSELSTTVQKTKQASENYWNAYDDCFKNRELFDKCANKIVDDMMKDRFYSDMRRDDLLFWVKEDDGAQNEYEFSNYFIKEDTKEGKALKEATKAFEDAQKEMTKQAKQYARDFLGQYGDQIVGSTVGYGDNKITYEKKLEDLLSDTIESEAYRRYTGRPYIV